MRWCCLPWEAIPLSAANFLPFVAGHKVLVGGAEWKHFFRQGELNRRRQEQLEAAERARRQRQQNARQLTNQLACADFRLRMATYVVATFGSREQTCLARAPFARWPSTLTQLVWLPCT